MSSFKAQHDPPSWWDRVRANPIVLLSLWAAVVGVKLALMPLIPDFTPSPSLGEIPTWTTLALAAGLIVGGIAVTVGLWNSWENRTKAWGLERGGWIITAAAWAGYALVVVQQFPGSTIAWGSPLVYGLVGVVRIAAIKSIKADARKAKARALADLASR